eukprot:7130628-Ditylum_brightwellii.AAC.1
MSTRLNNNKKKDDKDEEQKVAVPVSPKVETTTKPVLQHTPEQQPPAAAPAAGMIGTLNQKITGDFHGLFPMRQLWKPRMPYPLWDYDWDGRKPKVGEDGEEDRERERFVRKNGVTRHIILIRHGQYDETHKEDEHRILTELGRKQAELTGKRLAEMIKGVNEKFGPCNVK